MKKEVKTEQVVRFIRDLMRLDSLEFIGISKIMCVATREEDNKKARPLEDILSDLIDRYVELGRKQRREIDKLIRLTLKQNEEDKMSRPSSNSIEAAEPTPTLEENR